MFEFFAKLFKPFPTEVKRTESMGKKGDITFVEWYHYIARAWKEFPKGFSTQIVKVLEAGGFLILVVRITDEATGCYQEATGSAKVDKEKSNYGGATAEAESQALRRAFAKFGMGLEMYMDETDRKQAVEIQPRPEQMARMRYLVALVPEDDEGLQNTVTSLRAVVTDSLNREEATEEAIRVLTQELMAKDITVEDPT